MYKNVYIRTFGCQMNVHDSEKIRGILQEEGYLLTDSPRTADLIIFNTCNIRQKAEQKFYSELGRTKSHKKKRPEIKILVAGCIAQHEGENIFKKASHVDFVFGPQNIHMLKGFLRNNKFFIATEDNPDIAVIDLPVERGDGLKAWVTIIYGCNNYCSYCVVPYTRGPERSRPSEYILSEVINLAYTGYKEITLLGQNVNSYRSNTDFSGLLRKLDTIEGIERIRFVTSHPKDLSDELIDTISDLPKVCEHIHLPLQSGSSNILKLMNRGYTYDDYLEKISSLRKKILNISITSDIIAGFPGETDKDHLLTMNALKEIQFDGIFAFKFSPRQYTRAAGMENQVPENIKSERLKEILRIQDNITERINKSLEGTVHEILVEGESKTDSSKLTGRTRTNKIVNIPKRDSCIGKLINVEIILGRKHSLKGKPV
ncbi:MAG: tRNA (N6-isopentenyl adenosine(37)-C2)-methylthiotransferase MiaB [Nitrospirae bacterium]|nr:tRNA (N6-isopentenyl adenosine(37)-C2)-methylthiotransferase MiaB [Nitrospirota bacterium]